MIQAALASAAGGVDCGRWLASAKQRNPRRVRFGPRSDWYRNLVKTPECLIIVGSSRSARRARTVSPAEGADLMAGYAGHHPKAARALMRLMGFEVDGSEADYRHVAALGLRFVGLEPR